MKSLLAALFPSDCRFCQSSLFTFSRLPVCPSCIESIQPITRARCNICGDVLAAAEASFGDACCHLCSAEAPAFARAVNYGPYSGALRELIHLLKYGRVRAAAQPLGRLAAEACLQLEGDIDVPELVMIPVPAHKLRLRSRGFNQAELIARAAQKGIEEATGRRVTLETTAMLRVRFAESQVALTAEERQKQIRGAFKVIARERVKGREILLVDDVLTTGATAGECARELRQAGAARVWVVTPARALGQQRDDAEAIPILREDARIGAPESFANIPDVGNRGTSDARVSFSLLPSSSSLKGVAQASLPLRRGKVNKHESSTQGGQRAGWRLWASPL